MTNPAHTPVVLDEREETPAEEFARLIIEFNEGERQNRAEAWNLIADFACEHSDTIIRALSAVGGEAVAEQIADAVLSWMVKFDLLDAGNEYGPGDVLAVLNDLAPAERPITEGEPSDAEVAPDGYPIHKGPCVCGGSGVLEDKIGDGGRSVYCSCLRFK